MAKSNTFSLRIRDANLRTLIREVAAREGISQNELLEQAAVHEVVARGALMAQELESSAAWLRTATSEAMTGVVEASTDKFLAGEALEDPLQCRRVVLIDEPAAPGAVGSKSGATLAFERS